MNCANHPDRERTAFCQNCGKPLCQECTRVVGTAVFCEPCLAAKLSGAGAPPNAAPGAYPNAAAYGTSIPPLSNGEPNPGLAALLGIIPGVGAMYNGQYAKGIVHLVVFAILITLSHENGIFGIFIAGWVIYQILEAHHTAQARRDGTPLPNPFGLNDLGERLGFGKAWPSGPPNPSGASFTPDPITPPASTSTPPPPPSGYPPPPQQPYSGSAPWDWQNYVPPATPYGVPYPGIDPNLPPVRNRFPAGALWLIGLGVIFLIGNAGLFHGFPVHKLVPIFLIGLGVWLFIHKMTGTGATLADDGTPLYRMRLFSALRGSVWVVLVGVMFLLSTFGILSWGRSWPLFIIVAGLMTVFERTAYNNAAASIPVYPTPPPAPPSGPASTSIVPTNTHDQEGR
ncbi:MAG TPA: B-box zinc finger protein [Edaphobacter sp.]